MPPNKPRPMRLLTAVLPTLLLAACASASRPLPPLAVPPPAIPPLPLQARQPPPPPICSPTCSAGLTTLRASLLLPPTTPALPGWPASAAMTR